MPVLTQTQLNQLQSRLDNNDVSGFYADLTTFGDLYGRLGSEVTDNSGGQGIIANGFAKYGAKDNSIELNYGSTAWTNLNQAIAVGYLGLYNNNNGGTPSREQIQTLHNAAYGNAGLDTDDWLPNRLLNKAADPDALWADYLQNEGVGDLLGDALNIVRDFAPYLVGPYSIYQGLTDPEGVNEDLSYASNFLQAMADVPLGTLAQMALDLPEHPLGDLANFLGDLAGNYNWGWNNPGPLAGELGGLLQGAFNYAGGLLSPLTLDLDGDGVELISLAASTANFDLDANGFAERTGWVAADDGHWGF